MTPTFELSLNGEAEQETFGGRLARASHAPLLIFLDGDLGAGKTTLVRGFLRALGYTGAVKSPTYTLIEPYEIDGRRIYHLDLYRVAAPDELDYLGLREMLAERTILLVEWAKRGRGWLPDADLDIGITQSKDGRRLTLSAGSARGEAVMRNLSAHFQ